MDKMQEDILEAKEIASMSITELQAKFKKLEADLKKETRRADHNREVWDEIADLAEKAFKIYKEKIKVLEGK